MATTKRSKPTKKKTAPKPATRTKQTATEWAQSRIGSFRFVRLFGDADDEDDTAATVEPNDNGRWLWRVWAKPGGGDAHASGVSGRVRIAMKEADGWLTELGIARDSRRIVTVPNEVEPKAPEPGEKSVPAGPWHETGSLGTAWCRFFNGPGLAVAASVESTLGRWRWSARRSNGWGSSSPIFGVGTRAEAMAAADEALTKFEVEHDNDRPTSTSALGTVKQPWVLSWTPVMFEGLEGCACEKWRRYFHQNRASVAAEIWFHKGAWLWTAWGLGPNARVDGTEALAADAMEKADEALLSLGVGLDPMFSVHGRPLPAPPIGPWTGGWASEESRCRKRLDDTKYSAAMVDPQADGRWTWKVFLKDHQCPAHGITVDRVEAMRAADRALRAVGYVVDPPTGPSVHYVDRDAPPPPPQTSIPYVNRYTHGLRARSGGTFEEQVEEGLRGPFGEWRVTMNDVSLGKEATGATKVLATAKGRPEVKVIGWCDDDAARHRLVAATLAAIDPIASMPILTTSMFAKVPQERERHLVEYQKRAKDLPCALGERIDQALLEPFGEWIVSVSGPSQRFPVQATARASNGLLVNVRGDGRDDQEREKMLIMVLAAIGTLPPTKDAPKPAKAPEPPALVELSAGQIVVSADGMCTWQLQPSAGPWMREDKGGTEVWVRGRRGGATSFAGVRGRDDGRWYWFTYGRGGYGSGEDGETGLTGHGIVRTLLRAMEAADDSLTRDGIAHDATRPLGVLPNQQVAVSISPNIDTLPQSVPAPVAMPTQRKALIASQWTYEGKEGRLWSRTLPPHPASSFRGCAVIVSMHSSLVRWRASNPLTGQIREGAAGTVEGAAIAANKALDELGIEHDGLLPGQSIATRPLGVLPNQQVAVSISPNIDTLPQSVPAPAAPPTERKALIASQWTYGRGALWYRSLPPHAADGSYRCAMVGQSGPTVHWRAKNPLTGAMREGVDATVEAAAIAANKALDELGIEHDGLLPGQSIVTSGQGGSR